MVARHPSPESFVVAQTRPRAAPFVPELRLRLADDSVATWEAVQTAMERDELPPPFWAFVWAGGQALARHLLDHPTLVAGRPVVDLATGSGLVALAAAAAGARQVTAYDVDPLAITATRLNATLNHLAVTAIRADVREVSVPAGALVTAGDVFYDERTAAVMLGALTRMAAAGAEVLVGDPHRAYLPAQRLVPVAGYDVDVEADLEDGPVKTAVIARLGPDARPG